MTISHRIIFNDNGTENDYSVELSDFKTQSVVIPYVSSEDYLYIATDMPFNHKYFLLDTDNDQQSTISVEIWDGSNWNVAVDIIDETSGSDISFSKSGLVRWSTNRQKIWFKELDSEDVDGVGKIGIYSMYWLRISFSSDLNTSTSLKYIGNKFSSDADLFSYYPDLSNSNLMLAFATGKTSWGDQHFMSADIIVRDLKKNDVIVSSNQILNPDIFLEPACHKTAELIYTGLGSNFDDNRILAKKNYDESMKLNIFNIDKNKDGNLNESERYKTQRYMKR